MRSTLPLVASRRQAIIGGAAAAIAGVAPLAFGAGETQIGAVKLPRWRGFNLLEKFILEADAPYRERDFDFIAAFGFDYVRLPLDYRIWTLSGGGWREKPLTEIDQALSFARGRGIHVTLCLHRAPGYCVNPPAEPLDLWGEGEASDEARWRFAAQWRMFAARYKGISPRWLSFNLVNEPKDIGEEQYFKVAKMAAEAIRAEDPARPIIADGRHYGTLPTPSLAPLGLAQAGRGYEPFRLTHYRAPWVAGSDGWPEPSWPLQADAGRIDKAVLWRTQVEPWQRLERLGAGIIVGEWGVYNRTPHVVALAWMKDCLDNWQRAGWGWCLWNLRGAFGVIDSGRADVRYADLHGQKIDLAMLDLLRSH
jgi:endoglucanase